ncbi:MAG: carboxypeptidase-like regulatory domain-containing protein [Bacteroidales bacterium]|jgi:hypothetical protein|nr:carboxypeptidase-like regulatory domain-containing protein [Bacteroidales bacterium]
MRHFITYCVLFGTVQGIFAQNFDIKGVLKTTKDKEPVEYANILLQTADSAFVNGATSGLEGRFTLTKVAPGNYRLVISCVGYVTRRIELEGMSGNIDLGEILIGEESLLLSGVTIQAAAMTNTIDKKLVYPSERQVMASTNGINLLQQLMLPGLQVNAMFNEVSLPGGGELQFRINGVKVEREDVLALQPSMIIRVEYHDNPGLRYGSAEVVLDYIVRRPESGGNIGVELNDGLTTLGWGSNRLNARINHKRSEFSLNYSIDHRKFVDMWRNNMETFHLPDGSTLQRKEVGDPGKVKELWQHFNSAYNYQDSTRMFNATFRGFADNQPHYDYIGHIYNMADNNDKLQMFDAQELIIFRPALDLYYQQNMKKDQTLVLNIVGTYNYTDNTRLYQESRNNIMLTDVNNATTGKKYSLIGEGIYEKKIGDNRLSAGLRHTQSYSDNIYRDVNHYTTRIGQGETFLYTDFKGKMKSLTYTVGAGVTRSYFEQEDGSDGYVYYTFKPRILLHYSLPANSSIRLRAEINNEPPSLSGLSAVEQSIDSLQIQRGNPNLKPYLHYRSELTYEIQKGIFYGNFVGGYQYQPKAIMDEKYWEGDRIVQTWNNQKNWQRVRSQLALRVGPVKEIVQFSVTGGVNHYISNGNSYQHRYTNWYTQMELSATYKNFTANFNWHTSYDWFYGETLRGSENLHSISVGYKLKDMSFKLGMLNPFVDNYILRNEENRSQYASFYKTIYINQISRLLIIGYTYNFSFGRKFKADEKRVNNADNDSGIMTSGK